MEAPYRKAIIDHLNLVFGCQEQVGISLATWDNHSHAKTIQHWDTHIKLAMSKWYACMGMALCNFILGSPSLRHTPNGAILCAKCSVMTAQPNSTEGCIVVVCGAFC